MCRFSCETSCICTGCVATTIGKKYLGTFFFNFGMRPFWGVIFSITILRILYNFRLYCKNHLFRFFKKNTLHFLIFLNSLKKISWRCLKLPYAHLELFFELLNIFHILLVICLFFQFNIFCINNDRLLKFPRYGHNKCLSSKKKYLNKWIQICNTNLIKTYPFLIVFE